MDKELNIFIGISRIKKQISCDVRKILIDYDLTESQFAVLEAIYYKGELTIGEIQDKILTTSGNIAIVLKNLEKREYVKKHQDFVDKRKFFLNLTETGKELIERLAPVVHRKIVNIIGCLNKEEQDILLKLLKKISKR